MDGRNTKIMKNKDKIERKKLTGEPLELGGSQLGSFG